MSTFKQWVNRLLGDVGTVFYLSILFIGLFLIATVSNPDGVQELAQKALDATADDFGWLYLLVTSGFVIFTLWLGLSRFGSIRLGPDDEAPEFSYGYRKDADHAPSGGQDGQPGREHWSLPASPARANPALSDCRRILPDVRCPFGRAGKGIAGLCATGI
ncbi:BCCT family transporter [Acinetobacter sp. YH12036]|uniref:BCCT family transporter n=1 Tax=unclassified Acinetobacter TaxID=196816 RepID=UPI0035A06B05